jgi:2,3-dihydroxybenzoate-AMP ligase
VIPVEQKWPDDFAARYRAAGYWRGETFGQMLRERAAACPDRLAVIGGSGSRRWTYAELDARADRVAAGLVASGLRAGDRVIVHLPNVPEFFSVIFGMYRAGILPVFALPAHRRTEIVHFARLAEATAYVIPERYAGFDYRQLATEVVREVPVIRRVIVSGGEAGARTGSGAEASASGSARKSGREGARACGFIGLDTIEIGLAAIEAAGDADSGAARLIGSAPPRPSDVAFMQLSGGSTGLSKLIPRTHDDYIYSLRRSAEICRLGPGSVYLGALPIAHNFPMSSPGTLGTFYACGTVVLSPSPSPDDAFPIIAREKVTITAVVPPLALIWLDAARSTTHDLSSLQVLQIGGAKLTPEAARRVEPGLRCTLQQVFGMAEGLVNYTELDAPEAIKVFTQGRPMCPDDEVRIVDDEDRPVEQGTPGHLLTRGPYTIRGYHNDPAANLRAFTPDGFYRTGDIVSRDAFGYLTVHGRATDHINRGGEKVSAEEIEDQLMAHPDVHDAAVVAIADEMLGERTCAFVIARGDAAPLPTAVKLKNWMRGRGLAGYKVPDQIVFVKEFPSTGVGKTSRKTLRAALREQLSTPASSTVEPGAAAASVAAPSAASPTSAARTGV